MSLLKRLQQAEHDRIIREYQIKDTSAEQQAANNHEITKEQKEFADQLRREVEEKAKQNSSSGENLG